MLSLQHQPIYQKHNQFPLNANLSQFLFNKLKFETDFLHIMFMKSMIKGVSIVWKISLDLTPAKLQNQPLILHAEVLGDHAFTMDLN